jgi:transcriptional regulator with XRE-family HTH domain
MALWIDQEHYKIVGACLAAARQRAKLTQIELAERLGRTQTFVSEVERGQRRVDVIELFVIARGLGADPLRLFEKISRSIRP